MSCKLSVRVAGFTPRRSNTLVGFCDVAIDEMRLTIKEATVHQMGDRRWVALPAKPQINKDICCIVDANGKRQYVSIPQFTDKATSDAFSDRAIAALLERFPHAFDEEPRA